MGEAAEMLLDGTCCEACGEFLDGDSPGYTRLCFSCSSESETDDLDFDYSDEDIDDEIKQLIDTVGNALKEYKKLAHKFNCRKECKRTSKGPVHAENCNANKHKQLAKETWKIYKEHIEY